MPKYRNIRTGRILEIPGKMVSKYFECLEEQEPKAVEETAEKPKRKKKAKE